jgi:rhodanese-related sulfurtransferase
MTANIAPRIAEVDATTVKSWLDRGACVLVDVREPGEFAREHIPGATLAPLSRLDPANLDLPGAKTIVLHCVSGMRSARAAEQLVAAGRSDVANFRGGLPAWKQAGYPTVVDRSAPLPIQRQVQLVAGSLVLAGAVLGFLAHPGFFALSAFVGAGLVLAGATGWCGMATLLAKLPYNRRAA